LLTCLTAGLLVVCLRYQGEWPTGRLLCAGLLAGLMFTTKETALIAIGCMMLAMGMTVREKLPGWGHILLGLAVAVVVVIGLLGWRAALQALGIYLHRAFQPEQHVHPWYYYLRMLVFTRGPGGFFWSEMPILALAALGSAAAFTRQCIAGVDRSLVRFLLVYTLSMTACYSALPYKTPWCLLGFLYGMILLAGMGVGVLARSKSRTVRTVAVVALGACAAHLLFQAVVTSRVYASDPRNPYAYAHTSRDVYAIRDRLEGLAAADPQGREMRLQVLSGENVWPLPWYVRSFPHVEWWRSVGGQMQPASVILTSPDMEAALARQLYEVPPPGQRPLYVSMFRQEMDLRPGLELKGYVKQSLWDAYVRAGGSREDGVDR
jgi:predicted membrane-bound mannosyltransferase